MAYKDIEDSRAAIRRHYYENKEKYLAKNKLRRQKIKEYVNKIKASTPCADCKNSYPYYVMDFDHLRDKTTIINNFVRASNLSGLKKEIKKCEIVCANCHRMRTFNRIE